MRFIEGLTYGIRVTIARESEMGTTFHQAVEVAQRIERLRSHGTEIIMRDKMPHRSCSFSCTLFEGRGQIIRGY